MGLLHHTIIEPSGSHGLSGQALRGSVKDDERRVV